MARRFGRWANIGGVWDCPANADAGPYADPGTYIYYRAITCPDVAVEVYVHATQYRFFNY